MTSPIISRRIVALLLPLAAAASLAACGSRNDAPAVPLTLATNADSASAIAAAHAVLGPDAKLALDRGNEAFKKKDFKTALKEYREASALAPQHSAPLFGIYMVANATHNTAMADSALAGIRQRGGGLPAPADPHAAPPPKDAIHGALQKKSGT